MQGAVQSLYTKIMVGVAQLVEPRIVIPVVVGSSPIIHPIFILVVPNLAVLFSRLFSRLFYARA